MRNDKNDKRSFTPDEQMVIKYTNLADKFS